MTREEQLDGLLREALLKASNLYNDVERARRQNYAASPVLQFENWLRAEFIRTQAP